jgi:two-component system, OmpR family, response regulator
MIANFLRVGRPGSEQIPTPYRNPAKSVLLRVRQTANSIADRVRHAMLPADIEFTPLRVLVVDDHPDAADTLAAVLEMLDCPARTCYDGMTALAVAADFQPQVCLLDLMMPKMDGLELASRLREQADGRPLMLVATTAFGDIEIRTQTATAGFHYHLLKPIDTMTLIETLAHLGKILKRPDESPPEEQ